MTVSIPNIFFIIAIAITTAILTFLTTKGSLTDNRFSHPLKKLTKRGRQVLYLLLFMAVLLVFQELNSTAISNNKESQSKKEANKKDSILKKERDERDSTITSEVKLKVDSDRIKLFEDISKAFAKQEFRLDTVKKEIKKIQDSTKGITNNYSQPDPVILISGSGIRLKEQNDTIRRYSLEFTSVDAGSTNFNINCYLLTKFSDGSEDYSKNSPLPKTMRLPKNGKWEGGFSTKILKNPLHIYAYVKGHFTTLDGIKTYNTDDVYDFDIQANHVSVLVGKNRDEIIELIKAIPESEYK